jgi:DNA-binding transcriptional LysR family regulator
MSDWLRELTAFVRAGETGSFSRVARELGVSQPSISRMVADLEARLGVKLLLRTTRHVTPTEAGRVFLARAQQILSDLDDAENAARGVDSLRGTLRVALSGAFGAREVIPRLPGFAAQYPKLRIELLMSDRTEDLIAEGADMALRLGRLPDSGFGARLLGKAPRLVIASPGYLARKGMPRALADLAGHDCILGPGSFQPERLEFHTIGESRIRNRARVDNGYLGRWRYCLRESRAWNSCRLAMDVPDRARGWRSRSDPFRLSARLGRTARRLSDRPPTLS